MGQPFLHSVSIVERAVAADILESYDLTVNPISVINIMLRPLNDTGTLANFASYLAVASAMNRVTVLYRGEAIVSMRGEDLAALNWMRHGIVPFQGQHDDTDNERRAVNVPIILGKEPFNIKSCFPRTNRGELQLEIDWDVTDTGYDNMRFSVETLELLGANPTEYEKKVQVTQTMAATGDQDMDLPCTGNMMRGVLLWGTTVYGGASPAPTWGRIKALLDNSEAGYTSCDFETLQSLQSLQRIYPNPYDAHIHRQTANTDTLTNAGPKFVGTGLGASVGASWENYAFMDFDLDRMDTFSLDTQGKSRFQLRANVETADAVRAIPIEVIKVKK